MSARVKKRDASFKSCQGRNYYVIQQQLLNDTYHLTISCHFQDEIKECKEEITFLQQYKKGYDNLQRGK